MLRMSNQPANWTIIAIELSDAIPRRRTDKEPLYVSVCNTLPAERLLELQAGEGPETLKGSYLCLRQDLLRNTSTYARQNQAKAACRREKIRLARLGHSINGIATQWTTYVVDLDPTGVTGTDIGYVYVGQTMHTAEQRYAIHKGDRSEPPKRDLRSRIVHRRGIGLNYELMQKLKPRPPVYTQQDAKNLEKKWALTLAELGYRVEAGDATPSREESAKEPE